MRRRCGGASPRPGVWPCRLGSAPSGKRLPLLLAAPLGQQHQPTPPTLLSQRQQCVSRWEAAPAAVCGAARQSCTAGFMQQTVPLQAAGSASLNSPRGSAVTSATTTPAIARCCHKLLTVASAGPAVLPNAAALVQHESARQPGRAADGQSVAWKSQLTTECPISKRGAKPAAQHCLSLGPGGGCPLHCCGALCAHAPCRTPAEARGGQCVASHGRALPACCCAAGGLDTSVRSLPTPKAGALPSLSCCQSASRAPSLARSVVA